MSRWSETKTTAASLKKFEERFASAFGAHSASRSANISPYDVISTGSLAFDEALGVGGLARGRLHQFFGKPQAGKTTAALRLVASAQRQYPQKMCSWADLEQTFDPQWAVKNGVDLTRLFLYRNPSTAEDASEAFKQMVESGMFSVSVYDAVGAGISEADLDRPAEEASKVGAVAKVMTRLIQQISAMAAQNFSLPLIIGQVRANVDTSSSNGKGPKETTTGGYLLAHALSTSTEFRAGERRYVSVDAEQRWVGTLTTLTVRKNKVAAPGRVAKYWYMIQETSRWGPVGIDVADEAASFAKKLSLFPMSGSRYTLAEGVEVNGLAKLTEYIRANPQVISEIRERMIAKISSEVVEDTEDKTIADVAAAAEGV